MTVEPTAKLDQNDINRLSILIWDGFYSVGPGDWQKHHSDKAKLACDAVLTETQQLVKRAFELGYDHGKSTSTKPELLPEVPCHKCLPSFMCAECKAKLPP